MATWLAQLRRFVCALSAGVATWGGPWAVAAPLDPAAIPSDCAWVVHVDVEAWRSSELGRAMMRDGSPVRDAIELLHRDLGMDVVSDIQGATFVGWAESTPPPLARSGVRLASGTRVPGALPDDPAQRGEPSVAGALEPRTGGASIHLGSGSRGLVILHVPESAARQFAQHLRDANQAENGAVRDVKEARLEVDGLEIERRVSWRLDGAPWAATLRPRGASTMVVLGQDEEEIDRVLAGLGEAPVREGSARALTLRSAPRHGALVTVRAGAGAFASAGDRASRSPIFRDAEEFGLDVVEQRDEGGAAWISLDARAAMACEQTAERVRQAMQGLIALGNVGQGDEGEPDGVLGGLTCEREGATVTIRARQAAKALAGLLEAFSIDEGDRARELPRTPDQTKNK